MANYDKNEMMFLKRKVMRYISMFVRFLFIFDIWYRLFVRDVFAVSHAEFVLRERQHSNVSNAVIYQVRV